MVTEPDSVEEPSEMDNLADLTQRLLKVSKSDVEEMREPDEESSD